MDLKKLSIALIVVAAVTTAARSAPPDESKTEANVSTNPKKWVGPPKQEPKKLTIGSVAHDSKYMFAVELTSRGAAVNTIKLTHHFATVYDKRLFTKDPAAYEKQWPTMGEKYGGHYSLLNPVAGGGKEFLPLATKALHIILTDNDGKSISLALKNLDTKFWKLVSRSDDSATFAYELGRGKTTDWDQAEKVLRITKTYTVVEDDHRVSVSLKVENLSDMAAVVTVDQAGPTGLPREGVRSDQRAAVYAKRPPDQGTPQFFRKPIGELGKPGKSESDGFVPSDTFPEVGRPVDVGTTHEQTDPPDLKPTPTLWIGHSNQFFASMMYLDMEKHPGAIWKGKFYTAAADESPRTRTFLTGIVIEGLTLKADTVKEINFELFAGPKKRDLFTSKDHPQFKQQYKDLNYLSTINLKVCFCAFSWLSLAMMWLLQLLSGVGNYGVAIILLVVLVRIALHPLARKSQVSMMKMQKLAPQIKKLKEKYKDDKETLQKETMRFYKEQGATPLLGCLPMLLQMPIWIALWTSVQASVELRHAAFLPFWIIDLAAPDRLWSWAEPVLPVIGTDFNLLPLLLTVAMFLQTKMNPQMGQVAASDQQQQQQKMMKYMMPAMMLFIFYSMPSGVTLYIMASTFAGVAEQAIIRRHIRQKDAAAAARETTVAVPGKAPRKARPKKPKGPNWIKRG